MSGEHPLGRFRADGDADAAPVEVRLLGLPVRVLAASREHHDGLMREFRLLAMSRTLSSHAVPTRLTELTDVLGVRFGSAASRPDALVDDALDRGQDTVDLVYVVPPAAAAASLQLAALMAEADDFCRTEQLMTLPRGPVLAQFAGWYLEQFVEQVGGAAARRWDGPLDPD